MEFSIHSLYEYSFTILIIIFLYSSIIWYLFSDDNQKIGNNLSREGYQGSFDTAKTSVEPAKPTVKQDLEEQISVNTIQPVAPPTIKTVAKPTIETVAKTTIQPVAPPTVQSVAPPTVQSVAPPTIQPVANTKKRKKRKKTNFKKFKKR